MKLEIFCKNYGLFYIPLTSFVFAKNYGLFLQGKTTVFFTGGKTTVFFTGEKLRSFLQGKHVFLLKKYGLFCL